MGKYGEPWRASRSYTGVIFDAEHEDVVNDEHLREGKTMRIVDCVNACVGVEFHGETLHLVQEAAKMLHALAYQTVSTGRPQPDGDEGEELHAVYLSPRSVQSLKEIAGRFVVNEEGWPYND